MLLKGKNAVIYGAGGAIGGAVARAFAREGARVYLAGRTREKLERVAQDVRSLGGEARVAPVDALDRRAVQRHVESLVTEPGGLDISFNAISLDDVQGTALIELEHGLFLRPIANAMSTHFFTAVAAARVMAVKRSGVVLAITAQSGRKPYPHVGGFGVACAAIEAFCRQLAVEVGPHGVRVVCLRSSGSPDAPGVDEVFRRHAEEAGVSRKEFEARVAETTALKRLPKLEEVANAAVLVASDRASAMTAAIANITCGEIAD